MKQEELHFHTILQWILDLAACRAAVYAAVRLFHGIPDTAANTAYERAFLLSFLLFYSFAYFWKIDTELPVKGTRARSARALTWKFVFVFAASVLYSLSFGKGGKKAILCLFAAILGIVVVYAVRTAESMLVGGVLRRRGVGTRTVLITAGDHASQSLRMMAGPGTWNYHITAIVCDTLPGEAERRAILKNGGLRGSVQFLQPSQLHGYLQKNAVGLVIFDLTPRELRGAVDLLSQVRRESVGIWIRQESGLSDLTEDGLHYGRIGTTDFMMLNSRLRRERSQFIKRLCDIVAGIPGTVVFLLVSAVMIPFSRFRIKGPAIGRERYVGRDGKRYTRLSFRLIEQDSSRHGFLRILPLFLSLLLGDVSIVGVNPMTEKDFTGREAIYRKCLFCKPGLICPPGSKTPAQAVPFTEDAVRGDIEYAAGWSLWMDIVTIMERVRYLYERKHRGMKKDPG